MNLDELLVIFALLNLTATLWVLRVLVIELRNGLGHIDSSLAAAIQKVLEGDLVGSIEPINPIQAAIGQMLQSRLQTNVVDVPRTSDGKYSGEKVS